MVKAKEITIDPFKIHVKVLIGDTVEECKKYWDKNLLPVYKGSFDSETLNSEGAVVVMEEDNKKYYAMLLKKDTNIGVIVHECFHLVMSAANNKDCVWCVESDEFYAYMIEHIFNQVYKIWK